VARQPRAPRAVLRRQLALRPLPQRAEQHLRGHGQGDAGSVEADPLFADPRSGDFALRADSPANGFKPFDWRKAGVRTAVLVRELPSSTNRLRYKSDGAQAN
jgi:hypothetical protein